MERHPDILWTASTVTGVSAPVAGHSRSGGAAARLPSGWRRCVSVWCVGVLVCAAALLECGGAEGPSAGALHSPRIARPVSPGAAPVTLVNDGKAEAVIVIPDMSPRRKADKAAKELLEHIQKASGAKLPIAKSSEYEGGPAIFVGESEASKKAGFDAQGLGVEWFRVATGHQSLSLIGYDAETFETVGPNGQKVAEKTDSQGTLFGVYDFLERYLGVRWYWPGEFGTIVPKRDDLVVEPLDYSDGPVMKYRRMHYLPEFHPFNKETTKLFRLTNDRLRQGSGSGVIVSHTQLWVNRYRDDHPEYFALQKDGSRDTHGGHGSGHLSYANPEVLARHVASIKEFYEQGVDEGRKWWKYNWPKQSHITVLPNDCNWEDHSEEAVKLNSRRRSIIPALDANTELVHHYYARLAEAMKQHWPEKWLFFGAYADYTLPPQTVTYPGNAKCCVMLMDGPVYHKHPLIWRRWFNIIDQYIKMTGHPVTVWHYPCWPESRRYEEVPFLMPRLVAKWHREAKGKVDGALVCQGNLRFPQDHLMVYSWFRSMWNPDFDVQAALAEYCRLCYGPAAPAMEEYHDLIVSRVEDTPLLESPEGRLRHMSSHEVYGHIFPKEARVRLQQLESQARSATPEGSLHRKRVEYATAAQKEFYQTGADIDTLLLGNTSVLIAERGAPDALDGKVEDECWRQEGIRLNHIKTGDDAPVDSRAWLSHDDDALYIAVRCDEPEMDALAANAKERDGAVYLDDGIEIFICPQDDTSRYVQFVVNTEGVIFDGEKTAIAPYHANRDFKIEAVVHKAESNWSLELKVPFSELGVDAPALGTAWRGNIIRNRGKNIKKGAYSFARTMGYGNHNPGFFGHFLFVGKDRLREDFDEASSTRWETKINPWKEREKEPHAFVDTFARLTVANGVATLRAKMSKVGTKTVKRVFSRNASTTLRPALPVSKGDMLEMAYRGPTDKGHRSSIVLYYTLRVQGEKHLKGGSAIGRARTSDKGWQRVAIDLFGKAKVEQNEAILHTISVFLQSPPGTENSLDIDMIRVSPHMLAGRHRN